MKAPLKRTELEMFDVIFDDSKLDEHTALTRTHRHFTTGSSLPMPMQPSAPPILWSLEATHLEMLSVSLRDLPVACVYKSGMTGVSPEVLLSTRNQMKAAFSSIISLTDLLQATQSLLAVQVNDIFHVDSRVREHAHKQQYMLMHLNHRLWLEAPTSLPNTMTAHAAWKLGESIRRTIIASHLLAAATRASSTGIVQYEPFLASLPFDRRVALWDLEDRDPWLAYIDAKQTPLVSLQEWLDGNENSYVKAASVLQRILLILYQPWTHRRHEAY